MSNESNDRIEGLEPQELLRAALGDAPGDPAAAERAAEEERRVRAEIEEHLPDLEVLELLGRGGMGYVFRARQRKLMREVALKVVAPTVEPQADFAERFAREAQTLARLNHPNIVAVHDYGQDGSFCWLVMEYVDGSNLRDVIRAGRLEPAEALALIPKICDALQFAHDQGVVHRDVKPENILLDGQGGVKIADFGLAKLTGTPAALISLTGSQQVLGTFRYMAPEQLDRPLEVDHRADIYSLGVVFYEMLTGEIPMGRFALPSKRSAAAPEVDEVVLRALEKEPEQRYQHASEVKSDLDALRHGESPPGATPSREGPTAEPAPKPSLLAAASAAIFGVCSIPFVILFTAWLMSRLGAPGEAAVKAPEFRLSFVQLIGMTSSFVCLALMITGSVLGFRALESIRTTWPRTYGVGPAIVGAWAGILLVVNAMILTALFGFQDAPGEVPAASPVVAAILLVAGDVFLLAWIRLRFMQRCRAE